MIYELIRDKDPWCGLADLAEHQQRRCDGAPIGSGRGGYRRLASLDRGADLDGRSPTDAYADVEPQGDPHGVPTDCGGTADGRGGVRQGMDTTVMI